jgi:hypothetical protein
MNHARPVDARGLPAEIAVDMPAAPEIMVRHSGSFPKAGLTTFSLNKLTLVEGQRILINLKNSRALFSL